MDAFFTPIFIITMVCLLLECFSLLMNDTNMALMCRLIITILLYLAYILKRELIERALKQKNRKLVKFYVYVLFICATVSLVFHCLLFYALSRCRLYTFVVIVFSLPVALDEYYELQWLKERRRTYKLQSIEDEGATVIIIRPSLYYLVFERIRLLLMLHREDTGIV